MISFTARAARITSAVLCAYLQRIGSSLRIGIALSDGVIRPTLDDAISELSNSQELTGATLLPLWTYDQITLLSLGFTRTSIKTLLHRFKFFVDDSFGGLVMNGAVARIQGSVISISDKDPAARLRSLRSVMSEQPAAFLVVDGRGPYFRVGTGLINLAYAIGATIVPCSAHASPALKIRGRAASISLPLPNSRIAVSLGAPIHFGLKQREATAHDQARSLEQALVALSAKTLEICRDGWIASTGRTK